MRNTDTADSFAMLLWTMERMRRKRYYVGIDVGGGCSAGVKTVFDRRTGRAIYKEIVYGY